MAHVGRIVTTLQNEGVENDLTRGQHNRWSLVASQVIMGTSLRVKHKQLRWTNFRPVQRRCHCVGFDGIDN
jgi:hypothetical protein